MQNAGGGTACPELEASCSNTVLLNVTRNNAWNVVQFKFTLVAKHIPLVARGNFPYSYAFLFQSQCARVHYVQAY